MSSHSSSPSLEVDPAPTLSALSTSLDHLTTVLEPLLDRPWTDTLEDLDVLQKAKMNVLVAYGICDVVWILLKVKGVDPSTHPVMRELERIKSYYVKIKDAEQPQQRNKIDVQAAGRFIAHSIPKNQRTPAAGPSGEAVASGSTTPAEVENDVDVDAGIGKASRFNHLKDADTTRLVAENAEEGGDDEGDDAARAGSSSSGRVEVEKGRVVGVPVATQGKGKGKAKQKAFDQAGPSSPAHSNPSNGSPLKRSSDQVEDEPSQESGNASRKAKKRRQKVDPFTGQPPAPSTAASSVAGTTTPVSSHPGSPAPSTEKKRRRKSKRVEA